MAEIIKSLWIGDALGAIENLAITSFLRRGHEYHLYCYEPVGNVPDGTTLKDGNEILPASSIFRYEQGPGAGSVSAFSNLFRYKLLLEKGGWWVDADVVCLKPFNFPEPIVLASEHTQGGVQVSSAVLKLPAGDAVARMCYEETNQRNRETLTWGEIGPRLLDKVVRANRVTRFIKGVSVFCPIPWWGWRLAMCDDPDQCAPFICGESHAVHLWHEMWRRAGLERQATFPPKSLIAQLQRWCAGEPPM